VKSNEIYRLNDELEQKGKEIKEL